jgi:YD repeat-containing protein
MRLEGRTGRLLGAIVITGVTAGCGGGGSGSGGGTPTSPTNGGGSSSGPACRTYFTNENITTRTSGTNIVFNAIQSANFDTSTKKATTQVKFTNGSVCGTGVASYNSVADFVDEVRVIPPVFLAVGTTSAGGGSCGGGAAAAGSLTYHYDGSRRLTGWTAVPGDTTTFTAWDSSGRPTTGTTSSGGTLSLVYDDGARTSTATSNPGNTISTLTFDANGNMIKQVLVTGGATVTTTFDITSTATVCK